MNLEEEFDELVKPLMEFIRTHFDADYDIITINGHDAFINRVNDTMIELLSEIGFFNSNLSLKDKAMILEKKRSNENAT